MGAAELRVFGTPTRIQLEALIPRLLDMLAQILVIYFLESVHLEYLLSEKKRAAPHRGTARKFVCGCSGGAYYSRDHNG